MFEFFRRAPLVIICLFFALGVYLAFLFIEMRKMQVQTILVFTFILAIALLLRRKALPLIQNVLLMLLAFLVGQGCVTHFMNALDSNKPETKVIQFQIEKKLRNKQYIATNDDMRFLFETTDNDTLQFSDNVTAEGQFVEIPPPKLEWLFNQKKQMLANGITLQFIHSRIIKTSKCESISPNFFPQKIQSDLQNKITRAITDSSAAAILSALLLGETSLLTKEVTADYSAAGVVHILAVSGMHVALIYQLIIFSLKIFVRRKRKWLTFFIAMSLLWGYGAMTGFSASVVRACCMFSFFVLSDCFLLSRNTANTIAGSTILILFFQPFLIFNLGFLLSLSAVLGIVVIHPLFMKICYTENKFAYYLISSTSITLSAQITTLPLTLYIFHSFPTYFILANLLLVPWSTLLLYIGIVFLFVSSIPIIGEWVSWVLNFLTCTMNEAIHCIQFLPHAQLSNISFNFNQVVLSYLVIALALVFIFYKWKHAIHFIGICILLFIYSSYSRSEEKAILFSYYSSNLFLLSTESEIFVACDNDSLASRYANKLMAWKCQNNRSSQEIKKIPFPSYFASNTDNENCSFTTVNSKRESPNLFLNKKFNSNELNLSLTSNSSLQSLIIGKGLTSRTKQQLNDELIRSERQYLSSKSLPFELK